MKKILSILLSISWAWASSEKVDPVMDSLFHLAPGALQSRTSVVDALWTSLKSTEKAYAPRTLLASSFLQFDQRLQGKKLSDFRTLFDTLRGNLDIETKVKIEEKHYQQPLNDLLFKATALTVAGHMAYGQDLSKQAFISLAEKSVPVSPQGVLGKYYDETVAQCAYNLKMIKRAQQFQEFLGKLESQKLVINTDTSFPFEKRGIMGKDCNNGRTKQYGLGLPQTPLLHPYNPTDLAPNQIRKNGGVASFFLNLKLPNSHSLPKELTDLMVQQGAKSVETHLLIQDIPWQNTDILVRPHYWIDPQVPYNQSGYNKATTVKVAILPNPYGIQLRNVKNGTFVNEGISIHTGDRGLVVSSPNNMAVDGINFQETQFFFLCALAEGRAAITWVWLLNDEDHKRLAQLTPGLTTLQDVSQLWLEPLFKTASQF